MRREAAVYHTHLLLMTAGDVEDVVTAGKGGLEATAVWDRETYLERAILYNMSLRPDALDNCFVHPTH